MINSFTSSLLVVTTISRNANFAVIVEAHSGETIARQQRIVKSRFAWRTNHLLQKASQRIRYYIRFLIILFRSLVRESIGVNGTELARVSGDAVCAGEGGRLTS